MASEGKMSLDRIDDLMRAAFEELVARDGSVHARELFTALPRRIALAETDTALNNSGSPRWETNLRMYSIDCTKAGYLQKQNGYWKITDVGREALKLPRGQLVRSASKLFRQWKANRDRQQVAVLPAEPEVTPLTPEELPVRRDAFDRAEEEARAGIERHVDGLSPYELQDLVAHLLRAMGYHVAHNAPPGPDGGVDLIVYKDPLGTQPPRVKVQVKHRRDTKVSVREVRELHGLLHADEVGLIVSSGGFTSDGAREARSSAKHIDLMDLERLVTLWQQHYERLGEEGRAMLRMAPIYFLAPEDA